jgi:predicted MPP superfamily phosphohydrolase
LVQWAFFLADWALLLALPLAKKSFGPAQPPALLLAALRLPFAYLPTPWWLGFQTLGTLLVLYSLWIEPHSLKVVRQKLTTPKLPPGTPLRILHIADLHLERITDRERELQRHIHELAPDVILFSGDFLNLSNVLDTKAWADLRCLLQDWQAPLGVFATTGSPPVDEPSVIPHLLEGMNNIRCLHGEKTAVSHLGTTVDIIGLDCTHKPFLDAPKMSAVLGGNLSRPFTILLYHSPDLAPEAAEASVDLMLCGHTHGGQVRFPLLGAVYASSLYGKRFEGGRYLLGGMTLSVSRGVGMEGKSAPRLRFLCPPEITLWEITGS